MADNRETMETILGETSNIKGDLEVAHGIQIQGTFKGTLKSGGKVIIGEKGHVFANIEAEELISAGRIEGNVIARKRLLLNNTGAIIGDVKTAKLIMEEGALINGAIDMGIGKNNQFKGDRLPDNE